MPDIKQAFSPCCLLVQADLINRKDKIQGRMAPERMPVFGVEVRWLLMNTNSETAGRIKAMKLIKMPTPAMVGLPEDAEKVKKAGSEPLPQPDSLAKKEEEDVLRDQIGECDHVTASYWG